MEGVSHKYAQEVEKIIRSGVNPHLAAERIVRLRSQEQNSSVSFKEFAYMQKISYRSVLRAVSNGKLRTVQISSGRRHIIV